ncbi:hypothetical protein Dimus_006258 [Dionaea muscipula]
MAARRVKSGELKPFQRFVHFLVMKNAVPKFEKRDTSNFLDLTYMDHLMSRRLVNLPRVMIRHMSYVISMKDHELPYGDWLTMVFEAFGVPLVDKKGEEPKRYDYFEDTFLTMCKLTRENEVWWIGSGENRRRDDDVNAPEEEAEEEDEGNKDDFDWEAVIEEAAVEGESGSGEQFYDAEDKEQDSPAENEEISAAVPQSSAQQKKQDASGVDPSCPIGRIPEAVMTKLQAEFERKRANRFLADLEKCKEWKVKEVQGSQTTGLGVQEVGLCFGGQTVGFSSGEGAVQKVANEDKWQIVRGHGSRGGQACLSTGQSTSQSDASCPPRCQAVCTKGVLEAVVLEGDNS